MQPGERQVGLRLHPGCGQDLKTSSSCSSGGLGYEGGFADARLTSDHKRAALPRQTVEQLPNDSPLPHPPDQRRLGRKPLPHFLSSVQLQCKRQMIGNFHYPPISHMTEAAANQPT
jgi:hypothetical protein